VWGKSLSISLQSSKHPKEYPCFKKASDLACSKKKRKRKKGERDKKKEREEKERKEEGKSEGEPWLHTLKQLMHTNNQEPCSFSFPSLFYSTQIGTSSHANRDVPCFPNNKAMCQWIMPLMNKVCTHEERVSHTIAPTISRHPSGGKYTLVSKGMVHQSFTHIYLHRA